MINCKTTVDRLYKYLDRELTEREVEEVQEHLDYCPPCAKYFAFEAGVLRFIGDACRSVSAPENLRGKVLAARRQSRDS